MLYESIALPVELGWLDAKIIAQTTRMTSKHNRCAFRLSFPRMRESTLVGAPDTRLREYNIFSGEIISANMVKQNSDQIMTNIPYQ